MGEPIEAVGWSVDEGMGDHATVAMIVVKGGGALGLAQVGGTRRTHFMGRPQQGQVGTPAEGDRSGVGSAAAAPTSRGTPV